MFCFDFYSSLSTGSFDDSASEHSSIGAGSAMNNNTPTTSAHGPYGFSPLTLTDNCSTTTTDSEGDMYDSTNTNNSNNNNLSSGSSASIADSVGGPQSAQQTPTTHHHHHRHHNSRGSNIR